MTREMVDAGVENMFLVFIILQSQEAHIANDDQKQGP